MSRFSLSPNFIVVACAAAWGCAATRIQVAENPEAPPHSRYLVSCDDSWVNCKHGGNAKPAQYTCQCRADGFDWTLEFDVLEPPRKDEQN